MVLLLTGSLRRTAVTAMKSLAIRRGRGPMTAKYDASFSVKASGVAEQLEPGVALYLMRTIFAYFVARQQH